MRKGTTEYVNVGEGDVLCDRELKKEVSVLTYGFITHRRVHTMHTPKRQNMPSFSNFRFFYATLLPKFAPYPLLNKYVLYQGKPNTILASFIGLCLALTSFHEKDFVL